MENALGNFTILIIKPTVNLIKKKEIRKKIETSDLVVVAERSHKILLEEFKRYKASEDEDYYLQEFEEELENRQSTIFLLQNRILNSFANEYNRKNVFFSLPTATDIATGIKLNFRHSCMEMVINELNCGRNYDNTKSYTSFIHVPGGYDNENKDIFHAIKTNIITFFPLLEPLLDQKNDRPFDIEIDKNIIRFARGIYKPSIFSCCLP